jgi:hypothetical protein
MNNLNFCFENLSFNQIIQNKKFYQKQIIDNKLIGFKKIYLLDEEYESLALALTECSEFYWIKDVSHSDIYQSTQGDISEEGLKNFRNWCMHVDVTPVLDEENNNLDAHSHTSYVSMNMKTFNCDNKYGRTVFLDLIKLNYSCPNYFKEKLLKSKLEYHIAKNKDFNINAPEKTLSKESDYDSYVTLDIAKRIIDSIPGVFYPFRTHPITKETILFWPTYLSSQLVGGSESWFGEFKLWIKEYIDEDSNWIEWAWDEGDVIIFDNRCMLHSFTPGWKPEDRVFDQIILGHDDPFFERLN